MHLPTRTRLLTATPLIALTALAACGGDDDGDSGDTAAATTTAAPASSGSTAPADDAPAGELPDQIRIAYQQVPNGDLVVKNLGYLEEAFGPDVEIEWNLFA